MNENSYKVGITALNGEGVQLYTPINDRHTFSIAQARELGSALILMADLQESLCKRDPRTGRFRSKKP